jgi:hypothetical protein
MKTQIGRDQTAGRQPDAIADNDLNHRPPLALAVAQDGRLDCDPRS